MVEYTKEDILLLQDFLEKNRANLGPIDGKSYRPLIRAIMYNNTSSIEEIMKAIEQEDRESYTFLTQKSFTELPLLINHSRYGVLCRWRLYHGK